MEPFRNDPCPCGSGKKYKKCCLVAEKQSKIQDFEYRKFREEESALISKLMNHAIDVFGEGAIMAAWIDFRDDFDDSFSPENPMNMGFMPWFLYNWTADEGDDEVLNEGYPLDTTIGESLHARRGRSLSPIQKSILTTHNRKPLSFYEVTEIEADEGVKVRDLLLDSELFITDRFGSANLIKGSIILASVASVESRAVFVAMFPYSLRPTSKVNIFELKDDIRGKLKKRKLSESHLHDFAPDIRCTYLDMIEKPTGGTEFRNKSGDTLSFQKVRFDISSAEEAFEGLFTLSCGTRDSLMDSAKFDSVGKMVKVEFPWLDPDTIVRNKGMTSGSVLGLIKIDGKKLEVEVNSERRANEITTIINTRLEKKATFKVKSIQSLESAIEACESKDETSKIDPSDFSPEVLEQINKQAHQHWESWYDTKIPALENLTQRKAAKTKRGRDLLESLLQEYEGHNRSPAAKRNLYAPNIDEMRRRLKL